MAERSGRYRVYRVVDSVPHINLQAVDDATLYTVYESGYDGAGDGDLQATVDDLRTGDLIEATLSGDPDAEDDPWRLADCERIGGVEMGFAVDVTPPAVARDLWSPGESEPVCGVLTEGDERVGVCCLQPREPLPDGAFVPSVLAGLLPMESFLSEVPNVGDPATEALFLDPDPPETSSYSAPYGVVLLFTAAADELPERFREAYGVPRDADTRPAFDPYGV